MSNEKEIVSDFGPTASIESLKLRADLLRRLRFFFDDRGFFEVETPLLSADTVIDRHIQPIEIDRSQVSGRSDDVDRSLFLQTSPEFLMKRLLAAGATSIYQICKAFRQGESGRSHNPEFTMLEWYRVGDEMQAGMRLLAELVEEILGLPTTERMSYRDAFRAYADVDVFDADSFRLSELSGLPPEQERDEHFNAILARRVERHLGMTAPVLLFDYPASQAALARTRFKDGIEYAERFEIYVRGVELANGYHELLDADELLCRNAKVNRERIEDGCNALPSESRLVSAMQKGLPVCSGVALGVDRLFMLAQKFETIDEAIAFPFERA